MNDVFRPCTIESLRDVKQSDGNSLSDRLATGYIEGKGRAMVLSFFSLQVGRL